MSSPSENQSSRACHEPTTHETATVDRGRRAGEATAPLRRGARILDASRNGQAGARATALGDRSRPCARAHMGKAAQLDKEMGDTGQRRIKTVCRHCPVAVISVLSHPIALHSDLGAFRSVLPSACPLHSGILDPGTGAAPPPATHVAPSQDSGWIHTCGLVWVDVPCGVYTADSQGDWEQ
ncbi:hypothetical protein SEVIR_1G253050v4 [Setaria viridis]